MSLFGSWCAHCGAEKRRGQVLCRWCLSQVPEPSRRLLEEQTDRVVAQQRAIQLFSALRRGVALCDVRLVA